MQISLCICSQDSLVDVITVNCFDSMNNILAISTYSRLKLVTVAVHADASLTWYLAEMEHIFVSSQENMSSGYQTK